jgi:hypothetical protein
MANVAYKQFDQLSFADLEVYSVLPEHPIWSKVAELIDFSFADKICAHLYSSRGTRPYAPSLKFKLHLVQRYYNLSDREMEERVIGDLFIKRFLGLPVSFIGFDHSTIGLDRDRVGATLFDACHHYILAQAKQKGLWGDKKEIWIVDSFVSQGNAVFRSSYRLIKHAIVRVINHLKRAHHTLFNRLLKELDLSPLTATLPTKPTPEDFNVAFNQLAVLAYGILHWFERDSVRSLFWTWSDPKRQLTSLELQALLCRILMENVHPKDPNDPQTPFKKIERKKRVKDRIGSVADPDMRNGAKTRSHLFFGDKIQIVTSSRHGMVLNAEPIPGNEHDGERLLELLDAISSKHDVQPKYVLGDSAYGYGAHRRALTKENIQLVAPLKNVASNPNGLMSSDKFRYDAQAQSVTCPQGEVTVKSTDLRAEKGMQFIFSKSQCRDCPLKLSCTNSVKTGRTIFISDYYEEFQLAAAFNETATGISLLQKRTEIERKCNEMKNHNGLGRSRLRKREKRRIDVKLVGMMVNLKVLVKDTFGSLTLSFKRKRSRSLCVPIS